MRYYFFLLIFSLLSFVSCESHLPEGELINEPPATVTYQLSVNKTTIKADAEGVSETFGIASDDNWTVSRSVPWINLSDTMGAGDKFITVTVEANKGTEARTGTITVKGKSSGMKNISVSQAGKEYALSVDKTEITLNTTESSEVITITSDDEWIVDASETWVKVTDSSGSGNKSITIAVDANTSTESRTATITIKGSNSSIEKMITVAQPGKSSSYANGHEYVDLGLPSGLLWATCNVGAGQPEDYGDYFAWGETTTKSNYSWNTYKHCEGSYNTLTKYNNDSIYGTVDNKTVLDPEDDVAHVNWGGSWRMPTYDELDELKTQCVWTWTTQNGVNGYKVKSKKNSNSLFLPAAGYSCGFGSHYAGIGGNYWPSSLNTSEQCYAHYLYFLSNRFGWDKYVRADGRSVRPVCLSSE